MVKQTPQEFKQEYENQEDDMVIIEIILKRIQMKFSIKDIPIPTNPTKQIPDVSNSKTVCREIL